VSLWQLDMESEFVFVGDVGVTEPSGRSLRRGIEVVGALELLDGLVWDVSLVHSRAELSGGGKIPQAPRTVVSSGLAFRSPEGLAVDLRARYLGPRYATESRSTRLHSYTVWDAGLKYRRGRLELFAKLENLFDTDWESAEFYYASRLPGEPAVGLKGHHFTPGNDRNLRAGVTIYW